MFRLDLLGGRGVPIKTKPGGVYLIAISFIVPVTLTAVVLGNYLHDRILVTTYRDDLRRENDRIEDLTPEMHQRQLLEQRKSKLNACREELADVIHWNVQWSPVLQALAEHIPESVILDKLEVTRSQEYQKVPRRYMPEKTIRIMVPKRELVIKFHADARQDNRDLVPNLIYQLRYSPFLIDKFENIVPGPQNRDEENHIDHFEIKCIIATN